MGKIVDLDGVPAIETVAAFSIGVPISFGFQGKQRELRVKIVEAQKIVSGDLGDQRLCVFGRRQFLIVQAS